jgi:hypothetical protein
MYEISDLFNAIDNDDPSLGDIISYLEDKVDLNAVYFHAGYFDGNMAITPLLYAVVSEDLGAVIALIACKKVDVNHVIYLNDDKPFPFWPLLASVYSNDLRIVSMLLAAGADPNLMSKSDPHRTALFVAIDVDNRANRVPNVELVKLLIDAGAGVSGVLPHLLLRLKNFSSHPPVVVAARHFFIDCIKMVINAGADLMEKNAVSDEFAFIMAFNSPYEELHLLVMEKMLGLKLSSEIYSYFKKAFYDWRSLITNPWFEDIFLCKNNSELKLECIFSLRTKPVLQFFACFLLNINWPCTIFYTESGQKKALEVFYQDIETEQDFFYCVALHRLFSYVYKEQSVDFLCLESLSKLSASWKGIIDHWDELISYIITDRKPGLSSKNADTLLWAARNFGKHPLTHQCDWNVAKDVLFNRIKKNESSVEFEYQFNFSANIEGANALLHFLHICRKINLIDGLVITFQSVIGRNKITFYCGNDDDQKVDGEPIFLNPSATLHAPFRMNIQFVIIVENFEEFSNLICPTEDVWTEKLRQLNLFSEPIFEKAACFFSIPPFKFIEKIIPDRVRSIVLKGLIKTLAYPDTKKGALMFCRFLTGKPKHLLSDIILHLTREEKSGELLRLNNYLSDIQRHREVEECDVQYIQAEMQKIQRNLSGLVLDSEVSLTKPHI